MNRTYWDKLGHEAPMSGQGQSTASPVMPHPGPWRRERPGSAPSQVSLEPPALQRTSQRLVDAGGWLADRTVVPLAVAWIDWRLAHAQARRGNAA